KIFADGGITGRSPEGAKWSPDNSRFTFLLRSDDGSRVELRSLDPANGKLSVLVSAEKMANLAPLPERLNNPRKQEYRRRYGVASYLWAPDSQHLLFNANGQIWYYTLSNGTAVQQTTVDDAAGDPKFAPNGRSFAFIRRHNLYVHQFESGLD